MKRFITILFFLILHFHLSAQQFSQYNTGTLYDSFENPSQKTFTPDTSRSIAFNFLIPNFNVDFALRGNVQPGLKSRLFTGRYTDGALVLGQGKLNYINANVNAYAFMLKIYTSLDGDEEIGFFGQTKAEGRGVFSDEIGQMISDYTRFGNDPVDNMFNARFSYQVYHQIGFTYREDISNQFSLGFKVSGLLGVVYNKLNITHSYLRFDPANDQAFLSLAGKYYASFEPGKFNKNDLLPSTKNPGAAISVGATYIAGDGMKLQWNIKDLGFIRWNNESSVGSFDNTGIIKGLSTKGYEDSVTKTAASLVQRGGTRQSFTTPTDGLAEFSASKSYWLGYSNVKYSPTLVLSKELFYTGFTTALVNHFQYRNLVATLTGSYDDTRIFNLGGQLMIKSPNAEFYIGCDRALQTGSLLGSALYKLHSQISKNGDFTGANIYMGFSIKIGSVIEHPYNASSIPMGDSRGFLKRLWERITKTGNY